MIFLLLAVVVNLAQRTTQTNTTAELCQNVAQVSNTPGGYSIFYDKYVSNEPLSLASNMPNHKEYTRAPPLPQSRSFILGSSPKTATLTSDSHPAIRLSYTRPIIAPTPTKSSSTSSGTDQTARQPSKPPAAPHPTSPPPSAAGHSAGTKRAAQRAKPRSTRPSPSSPPTEPACWTHLAAYGTSGPRWIR